MSKTDNIEQEFWACLMREPRETMRHPLFALLTLAEPERWLDLELSHAEAWVARYSAQVSLTSQRRFATDCVDAVVGCASGISEGNPDPITPASVIATIRQSFDGYVPEDDIAKLTTRVAAMRDNNWRDPAGLLTSEEPDYETADRIRRVLELLCLLISFVYHGTLIDSVLRRCIYATNHRPERAAHVRHWRLLLPYLDSE